MNAKDHARVWMAASEAMLQGIENILDIPEPEDAAMKSAHIAMLNSLAWAANYIGRSYEALAKEQEKQDGN